MGAAVPNVLVGQQCMNYNDYLQHLQNKRGRANNTRSSGRHSPRSSGVESVKRSSASSQKRSLSGKHHGSQRRKKEYAPVLRNESRASGGSRAPSKAQPRKATVVFKPTSLPPWNTSTNAASRHRRIKSQAQRPGGKKATDDGQVQQAVKTHHIVCHARSTSGQRARAERSHQSQASRKNPMWSYTKREAKNGPTRSARRTASLSSTKAKRRRSNSKKAKSGDLWQPGQLVSRAPGGSHDLGNDLESQTLEMSYMNKETGQALQEDDPDPEQAREVRELFHGRQQVYANLDRGHAREMHGPLELPLSMESLNYCDKAEQFQSIDFFNCQGNPPLTFESKASQGGLQRQLIESFNDPQNAMHGHGSILRNDSLDLRVSESNQILRGPVQDGQLRDFGDVGGEQRLPSQGSPAQHERAKDTTPSEYNDFVRLNHLNHPEHAYVDAMGCERQGDLYDWQFGVMQQHQHQLPEHELQNPQVLHMLQRANEMGPSPGVLPQNEEGRLDIGHMI